MNIDKYLNHILIENRIKDSQYFVEWIYDYNAIAASYSIKRYSIFKDKIKFNGYINFSYYDIENILILNYYTLYKKVYSEDSVSKAIREYNKDLIFK